MRHLVLALAACGGGGHSTVDASSDASADDGTPTRMACTSTFGQALTATATFGRLDGYLVAIVPPSGGNQCNEDTSHVHLQVEMSGDVYDVAIDVTDAQTGVDDVHSATFDRAMPVDLAWAEGWHTGLLVDYVAYGVHSADLPLFAKADLVSTLTSDLASANHVSIYATTYGSDGVHLVHRNGGGHDGAIVTQPLSPTAHVRLLAFTSQAF